MVVGGRGLVLKSPTQEFDEREPFTTVRFTGEIEIVTELEAGPVEVVNLMARRGPAEIELEALQEPGERPLPAGTHLLYAARGDCSTRLGVRILRFRTKTRCRSNWPRPRRSRSFRGWPCWARSKSLPEPRSGPPGRCAQSMQLARLTRPHRNTICAAMQIAVEG